MKIDFKDGTSINNLTNYSPNRSLTMFNEHVLLVEIPFGNKLSCSNNRAEITAEQASSLVHQGFVTVDASLNLPIELLR